MAVLLAKVLLAPACVVGVSLAGRRWGVAVAGILGGLPVVAAPILIVLTLLHGPAFGAEAAAGTLLGLAALTLLVVAYGRLCTRCGALLSLLAGLAAFLAGVAVLQLFDPAPLVSLAFVAACFLLGLALLPRPGDAAAGADPAALVGPAGAGAGGAGAGGRGQRRLRRPRAQPERPAGTVPGPDQRDGGLHPGPRRQRRGRGC